MRKGKRNINCWVLKTKKHTKTEARIEGSCTETLKTRGDSFIWTYNSAITTTAGPLAQSAERGADNAKVVSSTLTRTTKKMFYFYLTFPLRNLISADKSVFFFFFKVMVGISLNQNHSFHIPHPKDTGMMSPGWWNETPKPRENSIIKTKNSATLNIAGPLAQSAERGADNAKVVSSILTWTI